MSQPPQIRILQRPSDGTVARGMLRVPPRPATAASPTQGHRFWEARKKPQAEWTPAQHTHFAHVAAHIRQKAPPWVQGAPLGTEAEVETYLKECLEICAVSSDTSEDSCLRKWMFAWGVDFLYVNNEQTGAMESKTPMVAEATSSLRDLRRRIDAMRARVAGQQDPASPSSLVSGTEGGDASGDCAGSEGEDKDDDDGTQQHQQQRLDRVINPEHYSHFTCPKEVHAVLIPNIFSSVSEWVNTISNNILAEYWALVHAFEGPRGYKHWLVADCEVRSKNTATTCNIPVEAPSELAHQLFRFQDDCDAMFRIVIKVNRTDNGDEGYSSLPPTASSSSPPGYGMYHITFYPPLGNSSATLGRKRKKAQFIAYIGTHLLEYSSIKEFKDVEEATPEGAESEEVRYSGVKDGWPTAPLLAAILDPRRKFDGAWLKHQHKQQQQGEVLLPGFSRPKCLVRRELEALNESQASVVNGLRRVLEIIHGPPGTGKSTTISHLIKERLGMTERILVTCTRNGAVDSLAAKLQGHVPMLVVGSKGTVGSVANEWRVPEQLKRHAELQRCSAILQNLEYFCNEVAQSFVTKHSRAVKTHGRYLLLRYTAAKRSAAMRIILDIYDSARDRMVDAQARYGTIKKTLEQQIWAHARVFVCTVTTSVRLHAEYVQCHSDSTFTVDTVIVDECGCTSETATAVLLRLEPKQLLLVGDHKQLPAFSLINGSETNHAQSLMERIVRVSPSEKIMLTQQYRMHPEICRLVSDMFYNARLQTKRGGKGGKKALPPLTWVDHTMKEEKPEGQGFSFVNPGEVQLVRNIVEGLPTGVKLSVAALAFYRAQTALMAERLKDLDVEVVTVDSVQGREFDVVILSCVRSSKDRDIGFLRDLPRMCVALSRSKQALYIVGDSKTLTCNHNWKQVHGYATTANRSAFRIEAAYEESTVILRETGTVPDHLVPRHALPPATATTGSSLPPTADQSVPRPKEEENFFLYYDPEAAKRGHFRPAAWHQTEALRQAQGSTPFGAKQHHHYHQQQQQQQQQQQHQQQKQQLPQQQTEQIMPVPPQNSHKTTTRALWQVGDPTPSQLGPTSDKPQTQGNGFMLQMSAPPLHVLGPAFITPTPSHQQHQLQHQHQHHQHQHQHQHQQQQHQSQFFFHQHQHPHQQQLQLQMLQQQQHYQMQTQMKMHNPAMGYPHPIPQRPDMSGYQQGQALNQAEWPPLQRQQQRQQPIQPSHFVGYQGARR